MRTRTFLDIVAGESASIFKLLFSEDEALLIERNSWKRRFQGFFIGSQEKEIERRNGEIERDWSPSLSWIFVSSNRWKETGDKAVL